LPPSDHCRAARQTKVLPNNAIVVKLVTCSARESRWRGVSKVHNVLTKPVKRNMKILVQVNKPFLDLEQVRAM
jgi:hypothetical protein